MSMERLYSFDIYLFYICVMYNYDFSRVSAGAAVSVVFLAKKRFFDLYFSILEHNWMNK